jgi:HlyD family secretion protein
VSFAAPPEFAALTGRDKTLADVAMAEQRHYATVRAQSNSAATSVLQQRLDQYRVQNEGLARQVGFNRKQQDLVGAELDGLKKLAVDGYVSTNRVRNTERVAAQLDGEWLRFDVPEYGVAPGQAAVLYDGDRVLGGGWIEETVAVELALAS